MKLITYFYRLFFGLENQYRHQKYTCEFCQTENTLSFFGNSTSTKHTCKCGATLIVN
jgi:hypothetical protein